MLAPTFQWRIQSVRYIFSVAQPVDADETVARGKDKSVPYKVRPKTQQPALPDCVAVMVSTIVSGRDTAICVSVAASMRL